MFKGAMTAIVTPFKDGGVDYVTLEGLIERQIAGGIDGIVPCGTTGESPTLSSDEHKEVLRFTVEIAKKRVFVIGGAGANNTSEAIELSIYAKSIGIDGVLSVSPYYNRPSQQGLYKHFTSIADAAAIPIILYNIPGRTSVNIEVSTMARMSRHKYIVGVKESAGSMEQAMLIRQECSSDFLLISGDDMHTVPLFSIGGVGVISVLSNVFPKEVSSIVSCCIRGEYAKAADLHYSYLPLIRGLFMETNPTPVKEVLSVMGKCSSEVRLPLCPMSSENKHHIKGLLKGYGLS